MLRVSFRLRRRRPSASPDQAAAEQLIALGGRRLADLIAPAALEVRRDHVRLDAHYARVLVVIGYPRSVSPGWLAPLVEGELPIEVSLHIRPAPLLRDLHRELEALAEESSSGQAVVAASLAARLARYVRGSLAAGLFAQPTDVALDRSLVVFNIQQLEEELRPVAIHLIASFVWNRVRRERRPRLLVVDEAWSLLRYPQGGAFISGMARRARKYYLGLVTITQDAADFLRSDHGRAVMVNAAMKLLMKQDATTVDPIAEAFRLTDDERQYLLGANKGEGLLFARGSRVRLQGKASPIEHRLVTTNPRELAELAATGQLDPSALLAGAAA